MLSSRSVVMLPTIEKRRQFGIDAAQEIDFAAGGDARDAGKELLGEVEPETNMPTMKWDEAQHLSRRRSARRTAADQAVDKCALARTVIGTQCGPAEAMLA